MAKLLSRPSGRETLRGDAPVVTWERTDQNANVYGHGRPRLGARRKRAARKRTAVAALAAPAAIPAPSAMKRKRRIFTAAQRRQQAARMKAYWAAKRKKQGKA